MSEVVNGNPEFSRLKSFLWPVHRHELKKLIPMLVLFFLINFNYNVLRPMKDSLIVTAASSGAEVIPFIKVWAMFPGSILLTYLFARLSNRMSHEAVFYCMMGFFLSFFFVFAFVLYPAREELHLNAFADRLQLVLPAGCKGLIAMIRYWSFTCFYVMAELWGAIILFVLFWGFANQVTRVNEAKRFYGLFGIGANFSGVAAGTSSIYLSSLQFNPYIPIGSDAWSQSMTLLISMVLVSGLLAIGIFRWMHTTVLSDPRFYDPTEARREEGIKGKMSLRKSFAYLFHSPYLICITLIVISYNIVINLVEVVWKFQVKELYPNAKDFNLYMSQVNTIIGIVATLTSLFVAGNSLRRLGWTFTAMLTPFILMLTSIGFFGFFLFQDQLSGLSLAMLGTTPLAIVVFFGSAQNVLSRAAKYTVFDATKEMAFIPLAPENKLKGKAAIDGICSRLGKSGGSVIHQGLLLVFSTLSATAPYVALSLFVIIGVWMGATRLLGKKFNELTAPAQPERPAADEVPEQQVLPASG